MALPYPHSSGFSRFRSPSDLALATGKIAILYLLDISQPAPGQTKMVNSILEQPGRTGSDPRPPPNTTSSTVAFTAASVLERNIYSTDRASRSVVHYFQRCDRHSALVNSTNTFPRAALFQPSPQRHHQRFVWILDLSAGPAPGVPSSTLTTPPRREHALQQPGKWHGCAGAAVKLRSDSGKRQVYVADRAQLRYSACFRIAAQGRNFARCLSLSRSSMRSPCRIKECVNAGYNA